MTGHPNLASWLVLLACCSSQLVGRMCAGAGRFFLPSCWLTRGSAGFGRFGNPRRVGCYWRPRKKKIKKIKQSARDGLIMALRKKKQEKEKKKEFRSARAQNGAIRREVRALARRHGCMRLFHVCRCVPRDRQKARQRPCQHAEEKAAGKRTRPAFGRAIGRPGPAFCRFARFSADSAISRQRRASGRSPPIDAHESVSDRIFGRRKCRGVPPYPPPP